MYLLLHFFVIDVFLYIVSIFREGSVYVDFLISLRTELTADDLRLATVMLVQTVQASPLSPLDKIKSINTDDIHVTIYKGNSIHNLNLFSLLSHLKMMVVVLALLSLNLLLPAEHHMVLNIDKIQ
jgi:hypothetical protein